MQTRTREAQIKEKERAKIRKAGKIYQNISQNISKYGQNTTILCLHQFVGITKHFKGDENYLLLTFKQNICRFQRL